MSRFQGYLVTVIGCAVSLLSFFFLPYLVISFAGGGTYAFTGFQLTDLGNQSSVLADSDLINRLQLLWIQPLLVALVLVIALIQLLLSLNKRRDEMAAQRGALGVLIVGGFTLIMLICRYFSDAQSTVMLNSTPSTGGSLYNLGFWGLGVGVLLAVIGGVIALRAER